jgi:hypothetical protein
MGHDSKPFVVKSAGGAASQLLALQAAIYISNKTNRPFLFKHYPFSTGGYWPLAISKLLLPEEELAGHGHTRGLKVGDLSELKIGKPVPGHPLSRKGFSYEKLLHLLAKYRIFKSLWWAKSKFRGEYFVNGDIQRLIHAPYNLKALSGGFIPIDDDSVHEILRQRFGVSGLPSPYESVPSLSECIGIHYRLGDKRLTFLNPKFKSGQIIDPTSIQNQIPSSKHQAIIVISDQPLVAKELLNDSGIVTKITSQGSSIWDDLKVMTNCSLLICTWSTVSQVASSIRAFRGLPSHYPLFDPSTNSVSNWDLRATKYYSPDYLGASHPIYSDFDHSANANQVYKD